ncbi:MAG: hypothetical protein U1E52_12860 [Geminicoccaceae bacterium]
MAQIIDIEERRKPRQPSSARAEAGGGLLPVDPLAYLEPATQLWQSCVASWGSLWLAPWGLRVLPIEAPREPSPRHRTGPRG